MDIRFIILNIDTLVSISSLYDTIYIHSSFLQFSLCSEKNAVYRGLSSLLSSATML